MSEFRKNDDITFVIDRFESTLNNNKHQYFDVEEFIEIIEYYIDNFEYEEALSAVNYAFNQHPNSYEIQIRESEVYVLTNKADNALKILNTIGSTNFDIELLKASSYLLLGDIKSYNKNIEFCLNEGVEQTFDYIYKIAVSYMSLNNWYDIAIKFLIQSYKVNKSNSFVLNDLAISYERIKDHKKAIYYYKTYLDLDPFDEITWFNLGSVYENIFKYKKAVEAYEYAITINVKYQPAYINIASIYINNEKYIKGINTYKELLNYSDYKHGVYCLIGECYERIKEYDKAYSNYTKALKIEPKFSDAWFGLAMVKFETEEYFESLYFIKRALLLDEENEEFHFELGNVNLKLEFYEDAIKSYKRAININPIDDEFSYTLSDLYYKLKDVNSAMEVLLRAEKYTNDSAEIKFRLAFYYAFNNDTEISLKYFNDAMNIDSSIFENVLNEFSDINISDTIKDFINKQKNNE